MVLVVDLSSTQPHTPSEEHHQSRTATLHQNSSQQSRTVAGTQNHIPQKSITTTSPISQIPTHCNKYRTKKKESALSSEHKCKAYQVFELFDEVKDVEEWKETALFNQRPGERKRRKMSYYLNVRRYLSGQRFKTNT